MVRLTNDGFIWMNGALIPWTDARVRIHTHSLHYASSVFEGERAYAGTIFKLREHTDRLIYSAKELGFEIPYAAKLIRPALKHLKPAILTVICVRSRGAAAK